MNEEINKYLTKTMGECYHAFKLIDFEYKCQCGIDSAHPTVTNNNFFTWQGFGKLFTWSKEQGWWIDFILYHPHIVGVHAFCKILEPGVFARSIYAFLNRET